MEDKKNDSFLMISFLLLISLPAYRCLMFILSLTGVDIPLRMFHIYLMLMFYMLALLIKYKIPLKNAGVVLGIIAFYGVSYMWASPQAKQYFNTTEVTSIFLAFAPIAFFCTARVNNWEKLFDDKFILVLTDAVIVLSLISKIQNINIVDYMTFSYELLPLWGLCLVSAFCYKHKLQWIFVIVGAFEGLIYGSRAPILWLIVLAFVIWLLFSNEDIRNKRYGHLVPGILMFIIAIVAIQFLLPMIMQSTFSSTSYVLRRLQGGSLFEGAGRNTIYAGCRNIIREMGFSINGLFYDRTVLPNGLYSHNIVYEVLISLGWVLGIPFLLFIFYSIGKSFFVQNNNGKVIVVYFVSMLFLRYFVSGSIFDETQFVLFMGFTFSMLSRKSLTRKEKQEI